MATGNQFQAFPPGTSATTVTGPGNPLSGDTVVASNVSYQVVMSSTGTVNWEHTIDGTNWVPLQAKDMSSGALATSATASGIYNVDATGSFQVRPNVAANAGSITITCNLRLG